MFRKVRWTVKELRCNLSVDMNVIVAGSGLAWLGFRLATPGHTGELAGPGVANWVLASLGLALASRGEARRVQARPPEASRLIQKHEGEATRVFTPGFKTKRKSNEERSRDGSGLRPTQWYETGTKRTCVMFFEFVSPIN